MGPMGELGALFNPGMRHELEERRSKAARREEEGNARDGDLHIDLASGIAVINVPSDADADAADSDATQANAADAEAAVPVADSDAGDAGDRDQAEVDRGSPAGATSGDVGLSDEATAPATAEPATAPPVRPRGKRGMTSSSSR